MRAAVRRRLRAAGAAVVIAVLIAGCSTTADTDDAAPISSETTTTSESTTTTIADPNAARQQAYFFAVTPYNDANDETSRMLDAASDAELDSVYRSLCATMAAASEQFAADLQEFDGWGDAQDEVDRLVQLSAADAGLFYECAQAPSDEDLAELTGLSAALGDDGLLGAGRVTRQKRTFVNGPLRLR